MELLAPAGDLKALRAAINNGADAVYFGSKSLNARIKAENFDNMAEAVRLCHLYNVKAYLTLNTALKNSELSLAEKIIDEVADAGIDAIIITDTALLPLIKNKYPHIEVHASTQMGIHNREGAKLAESIGFDRIILSRECTLDDIKDIKSNTNIPIEVFVHGALCVSFSGACLFSGMLTGNSGNRGRCLQFCRKEYAAYSGGEKRAEGFLLSAKDICLIKRLKELADCGVSSLKIEGRLRRAEYAGGVVREYRKALDSLNNPKIPYSADKAIINLKKLYNRGEYTKGYGGDEEIIYPVTPGHIGIPCGRVEESDGKRSLIKFDSSVMSSVSAGDGFKVTRNGEEVSGFGGNTLKRLENGLYSAEGMYRKGDIVRLTTDEAQGAEIMSAERKIDIEMRADITAGKKAELTVTAICSGVSATVYGNEVQQAKSQPLTQTTAESALLRLGGEVFRCGKCEVRTSGAFMAKSEINALRREAVAKLEDEILKAYPRKESRPFAAPAFNEYKAEGDFAEIDDVRAASPFVLSNIKNIVYSPKVFSVESCKSAFDLLSSGDNRIWLKLPVFANKLSLSHIFEACIPYFGLICNNYYAINIAIEQFKPFLLGINMNVFNDKNIFLSSGNFVYSAELNANEIRGFDKNGIIYAYGRLPLMHFVHCPKKTAGIKCGNCGKELILKDEKECYNIYTQSLPGGCVHHMQNAAVTDVARQANSYTKYIDLSGVGSQTEIEKIITDYCMESRVPTDGTTRNHLTRGVL